MTQQTISLRLAVSGQAQVTSALATVQGATESAAGAMRLLAGAMAVGIAVKGAVEAADSITALRNSLKLATGSVKAAGEAFDSLFSIAQASRTSFVELGGTFATISRGAQSLGLSQERLLTVTAAIGNAMTVSGGSAESMKDALMQLGQGLGSGTLRGEELNSVMEQTPRLAQALAEGLGVSVAELRKLGEAGALTSQQVILALEKAAPKLASEVQNSTMTVGQAFTVLGNSATRFAGEADRATGATGSLAGAMQYLANAIDGAGDVIARHQTAFGIIGTALAGAAVVAGVGALASALGALGTAAGVVITLLAAPAAAPLLALLGIGAATGALMGARSAVAGTAKGMADELADLARRIKDAEAQLDKVGDKDNGSELTAGIRARLDAMRARRAQLQGDLAEKEAGGLDNRAEDARIQRGLEQQAAQQQALKRLAEVRQKLSGQDKDYLPTLQALADARAAGVIQDREYVDLVTSLAKETYKASDSDKAAAAAAKQNADRVAELMRTVAGKVAAGKLELQGTLDQAEGAQALTGAQKYALEVMEQLRTGHLKLSDAQARRLGIQLEALDADERAGRVAEANAKWATQAADESARTIEQAQQETLQEQEKLRTQLQANEAIGLSTTALAALEAARLRDAAAEKERRAELIAGASPALAQEYRDQAKALRERAAAREAGGTKQGAADALEALGLGSKEVAKKIDLSALKDAASGLSGPLGLVADKFKTLIDLQGEFAEQQRLIAEAKKGDAGQVAKAMEAEAKLGQQMLQSRLSGYASMAGAAKGFFEEGSRGYKILSTAEKGFRVLELANAAANAARQLGLIGAVTTAKVASEATKTAAVVAGQAVETGAVTAGEAARNTAKVPGVFMAFMSALGPWGMAAAGVAIAAVLGGAFGGGGGPVVDPGNQGTGTVLGDKDAKSESIGKALEALHNVDLQTMRYSAQMAASLRNIEASIAGVAGLIVRAGGVDGAAAGVEVGTKATGLGQSVSLGARAMAANFSFGLTELLGVGRIIDGLVGKLFNAKTTITAQGIAGGAQRLGDIMAGGYDAQYYADTYTRKKALGFTYSRSSGTVYDDKGTEEIDQQFGLILAGFADTVRAASVPLGFGLDQVEQRLNGFVVNLGKINLKDLTGEQIQEKLTAVFGAAGDSIAREAMPGLDDFQHVGEGYLETVARVASGVEVAGAALDRLGVHAIAFTSLYEKQGDVAAELVRQSLRAVEGASGIGRIVEGLDGSAAEIADAYQQLDALRESMRGLGLRAADVTALMLQGAGGLSQLADGLQAFREGYYSEAEQLRARGLELADAFRQAGRALPQSREAFRAMVEGIDRSSEAGQKLFGTLMTLADGFGQYADDAKAQARAQLQSSLDVGWHMLDANPLGKQRAGIEKAAIDAADGIASALDSMRAAAAASGNRWDRYAVEVAGQAMAQAQAGLVALTEPLQGMALKMAEVRANAQAMRPVLQQLYGSADAAQRIVLEGIERQRAILAGDFMGSVSDKLLQLTDASAYAAQQLQREQQARLADAAALGLSSEQMAKVLELNRAQTQALQKQADEWKTSAGAALKNWLNGQQLGATSTLDPAGKLAAAQGQFGSLLEKARGGDQAALGNITGAADALLQAGQAMYGSSAQYVALQDMTRQTLVSLGAALSLPGFSPTEQRAEAERLRSAVENVGRLTQAQLQQNAAATRAMLDALQGVEQRLANLESLSRRQAA